VTGPPLALSLRMSLFMLIVSVVGLAILITGLVYFAKRSRPPMERAPSPLAEDNTHPWRTIALDRSPEEPHGPGATS
jgi:hypothetical protein